MSRIDDLIQSYSRFVQLPWPSNLATAQRVWMAVYPPDEERRLRLHLGEFANVTKQAGHSWELIDVSSRFEDWMARHEYREAYFANPKLMQPELLSFFDALAAEVAEELAEKSSDNSVVALLGAGSLFGLGDHVKVSALIERVHDLVVGRLLVFFPGELEGNSYRLLGARDGWNYLATPITSDKGGLL